MCTEYTKPEATGFPQRKGLFVRQPDTETGDKAQMSLLEQRLEVKLKTRSKKGLFIFINSNSGGLLR